MAEDKDLDLKKEKETPGTQSDPKETDPKVTEDLEKTGETDAEKAERLLKDGTNPDKDIKVNKKNFDDKSKKAKLYETHAPLLDRVLQDPALVESLLETNEKGNLGERLETLEKENQEKKKKEIHSAVTEALSRWSDFEKLWPEIQPIAKSLADRGLPFSEALRRGYLAINPDAAVAEKERIAKEGMNNQGQFNYGGSFSPRPVPRKENYSLNDNEKRIAQRLGVKPEEYARQLATHKEWLDTHGFSNI